MFDFHLHSSISFDSQGNPAEMCRAALNRGLWEICFTDHYDYNSDPAITPNLFTMDAYSAAYDSLTVPGLTIRRGVEYGLTAWNQPHLEQLLNQRKFDFVIGSIHFVDGCDPYDAEYWMGTSVRDGFAKYLEATLECVRAHSNFDVLGHLTYVCKSAHNTTHEPVRYEDFRDICDEIMKTLVTKGISMEINTSGVDRVGGFLPSGEFLRRYRELGGEIVTVGSDSHDAVRVGQYIPEALEILKDIFGHVCTFENRKPVFHKL